MNIYTVQAMHKLVEDIQHHASPNSEEAVPESGTADSSHHRGDFIDSSTGRGAGSSYGSAAAFLGFRWLNWPGKSF